MQTIWPNIVCTDARLIPSAKAPARRLFVIKTSLNFYTIHFYINLTSEPDIIIIGPFRSDNITLDDFSKNLDSIPFLASKHSFFLNYYENLPCVSLQDIVNTTVYIINTYMLFEQTLLPIYADFTTINESLFDSTDISDLITEQQIEHTKNIFRNLLKNMMCGNVEKTQNELKNFLTETSLLSPKNFSECKKNLHIINHYFQVSLLNANIQHLEAAKLYVTLIDKIERIQTRDELVKMAYDMCYTYCMLFQNNLFPEYSKIINEVINYIHMHLQEPLNLSFIANHFNKNASRLSSDFKQETGMTITNYIQQTRINRAIDYLHNTALPVSEVALATGFEDFAYFSRVFKKHTGYSPKEYRDMQNLSNKKGL